MAYQHNPGEFTLFKNDYKQNDRHPDYKGHGCGLDGRPLEIAGWARQGAKGTYLSLRITEPRLPAPEQNTAPAPAQNNNNGDLPF